MIVQINLNERELTLLQALLKFGTTPIVKDRLDPYEHEALVVLQRKTTIALTKCRKLDKMHRRS